MAFLALFPPALPGSRWVDMPVQKTTRSRPHQDTFDETIDGTVREGIKELRSRNDKPYDGVVGEPDDWIPGNFRKEFHAARNRLLDAGYTVERVRDCMEQERRRILYAIHNPEKPYYGGFVWPPEVRDDVLTLVYLETAVGLGPERGLALLTDETHAKKVNKGERYGQHQSSNAKRPRGKIREGGPTISQIIGRLSRRQGQSAKDLWDAFYGELDEQGLNPQYMSTGSIAFDFKMERKPITFGTFEKTVSQYRTGKKKLP